MQQRETNTTNPLRKLVSAGQSIWLDDLGRDLLKSGKLQKLLQDDAVTGLTSNPAIFEKSINGSSDYDNDIAAAARQGSTPVQILRKLMIKDIQDAADVLRPVYVKSHGTEGFVSLEVSPLLAHDADGSFLEAMELWEQLDRRNVMIKIPGTRAGLRAIRRLAVMGVNVNVTLLFALGRYQEVCEAWIAGLEERIASGKSVEGIVSVASFFLSRIDTKVDPLLRTTAAHDKEALDLVGKVAISNAKLAYQHYQRLIDSARFSALARLGAIPQRLLWASTGTKDPAFSDVHYVEALIGPDTINTLPMPTLTAYRDHGEPTPQLTENLAEARTLIDELPKLGINLEPLLVELEEEGLRKFVEPHEALLNALQAKSQLVMSEQKS